MRSWLRSAVSTAAMARSTSASSIRPEALIATTPAGAEMISNIRAQRPAIGAVPPKERVQEGIAALAALLFVPLRLRADFRGGHLGTDPS